MNEADSSSPSAQPAPDQPNQGSSAQPLNRWHTTTVLFVVMATALVAQSFGRFTYPIVLPAVRDYFDTSNTVAGLLGTLNVGAYLAGTMVVAALATSLTLVGLTRAGLVLSISGLALLGVAPSPAVVGLALVLTGLGGALIWIPAPRLAIEALPPRLSGVGAGLAGVGISLGLFVVGRVAPTVQTGDDGTPGWQRLYRVECLIAVCVLVAVFAVLRNRGRPAQSGGFGGFDALKQLRDWKPLVVSYAAFGFMYLLVLAFFTARLVDDAGFSKAEASSRYELIGLAGVGGGLLAGRLSDLIGRGRTLTLSFVGFGLSTLAVLTSEPLWVAIGAVGIGFNFAGIPTVIAAAVVDGTDHKTYSPAYAAATLAFGLAQISSPQIGGWLADLTGSFTATLSLAVAFATIGAVSSSRVTY